LATTGRTMMTAERSPLTLYERAEQAARTIRARNNMDVSIALVLGSGLGGFADDLQEATAIPYHEIPGFARSTVEGHAGRLVIGRAAGVPLAALQGRFHYYEGYSSEEVTFPIRVMKLLGARTLVLTNASGAVNVELSPGALMVISDQINLMGINPLMGPNDERFGPRFPDLSDVYSRELQDIAIAEANAMSLEIRRGIYAGLSGPSYETPAEIRMVRTLGADAVGMSTVPEAIVARHMGMGVLGISCITNLAAGVAEQPIDHHAVIETGERVRTEFTELLRRVVGRLETKT
jgi:purine-nucleoside phosphorylase